METSPIAIKQRPSALARALASPLPMTRAFVSPMTRNHVTPRPAPDAEETDILFIYFYYYI